MPGDFPGGLGFSDFMWRLNHRVYALSQLQRTVNGGAFQFVMPIGIFLVIDQDNGGGITGDELIRRFHLLDAESKNAIDFYFLGWEWRKPSDYSKGIRFDLAAFEDCRRVLKSHGITNFGGSADLILVDVRYRHSANNHDPEGRSTPFGYDEVDFNFPEAIQINLASSSKSKKIPPIGELLQSIIAVAEGLHEKGGSLNPVYSISDKLGLATAKQSFLDFIFKKWGSIIGADKLAVLAVRNLGPVAKFTGDRRKDNVFGGTEMLALALPRREFS